MKKAGRSASGIASRLTARLTVGLFQVLDHLLDIGRMLAAARNQRRRQVFIIALRIDDAILVLPLDEPLQHRLD